MDTTINVNSQNAVAAYKQTQAASSKPAEQAPVSAGRDTVEISQEGKALISKEMEEAAIDKLNMNVDDNSNKGELTYFTTFAEEFSKAAQVYIDRAQTYYSEAHKENLKFDNPAEHIWNKYKNTESEYFRSDMSELERAWSYDAEIDMLSGCTRLQMNNPLCFR